MAIISSAAIGKAKGSLGNLTYRYRSGATIASQKIFQTTDKKSVRQMVARVGWGNLVNLWQAFTGSLHPSFEAAQGRVSDFNLFMGRNRGMSPYLTREYARLGGCVVGPYMVTEGGLPSIDMSTTGGGQITTSLKLGSLVIGDEATLAAFSAAIIANNDGWQYGDQLSVFVAYQFSDTVTGVPRVTITASEVTLKNDPDQLVVDLIADPNGFGVVDQKLCVSRVINGAACYVHSRIGSDGRTEVSTQHFHCTNSLLATYSNTAYLTEAIISYGGKTTQDFLTPNFGTDEAFGG